MFIVYAHRGASEYAPENTMSSFYLGLQQGANGIETDVRRTKDGVLVLFHDRTLERVVGIEGTIGDYTYAELMKQRVKNAHTETEDVIVAFEDFLRYFGFRDLHFAIELKDADVEEDVLRLLMQYGVLEKTTVTSFHLEYIEKIKLLCPLCRVGYLTADFDEETLLRLQELGGEQLCPQAENLTPEKVAKWHGMGYEVRAWGCSDVHLMRHAYHCGVDGMTVNFPDRLVSYMVSKQEHSVERK